MRRLGCGCDADALGPGDRCEHGGAAWMGQPENAMPQLDEAVRRFTAQNLDRGGVVTGWVLMVASSRFDDEGEMRHAYDYSVGPDMDLMRAVGLVELGRGRIYRHLASGDD